jgi:hypothetical protein
MKLFLCFQYTYVVEDPKNPPPKKFLEQAAKEEKFKEEYLNKTGKKERSSADSGPRTSV